MADEQFADRLGTAGAEGPPQAHRGDPFQRLAWLSIPLLVAVILVLWVANLPGSYGSNFLILALNFIFSTVVSGLIVYLISRSFLARGTPGLLMLGCGVLTWGAAGVAAKALNRGDANLDVTIHNVCIWLSALFHLTSALLLLRPRRAMYARELWLGAAYAGTVGVLGLVALAALHGYTPPFFVQGAGGTTVRQFVLGSAIVMFLLTAGLLKGAGGRPLSAFLHWYTLALALIAIGLFGIMIESVYASLLSWAGLTAQFLGGVFMFIAAIASVRESGAWRISLEMALRESEERFRALVTATSDVVYRMSPDWSEMRRLQGRNFIADTETPSRTWLREYIHPDDQPRVKAAINEAIRARSIFELEHRVLRVDGSLGWTFSRAIPLLDANGEIVEWFGAASDVTERKRAEARLTADLAALTRMHSLSARLLEAGGLQPLLQEVMDAAVAIMGAERGTLQLLDGDSLRIVAHHGHEQPFLDFFAAAENRASVCGEATKRGERVVVPDVEKSDLFAGTPSLDVLRGAGVRAVQSTPMVTRKGALLGILTTQWSVPHSPDEHDLWRIDLLVRQAADLVEYAQAEEALRDSERRERDRAAELATVLDAMPTPVIIVHDPDSLHMTGNRATDELLRHPYGAEVSLSAPPEAKPHHFRTFKDGRELGLDELPAQRAARGELVQDFEFSLVFDDGMTRHVLGYGTPLRDDEGRPRGAVHVLVDITERKRAEEALRESEERFRLMGDTIPYGAWMADAEGRNIYISPLFLELVGRTFEQVKEFGWTDKMPPEDVEPTMRRWMECTRTGRDWEGELRFPSPDGRWHTILSRGRPVRDAQGQIKAWVGINLDITERKQAERELKELNESLEKRVAERTAVAEVRAEQLRMLAQELTQAEQRERQRIAHILHEHFQQLLVGAKFSLSMVQPKDAASRESLQRADQVLAEAVEASRSLAVELSPPILRYGGLAPALGWLGQWMHEKNGLKVEIVAEPHVPMPAEDVQVLLFQAVRELLLNVVKHAKVDQAKVELKQEADRLLRLRVSDKGAGFHADGLLTKACIPGGFGLFSIRERLGFLEGRVEIQSAPGAGTCISLLVPLPPARHASAPAQVPAEGSITASVAGEGAAASLRKDSEAKIRVLVADDHAIVRDGIHRLLQTLPDMEAVGQAKDGREAVELALQLRPDVVIMDVSMPELNGIEATRSILADLPATRIIGLSMHADQDVAEQMRQAGAVNYLAKSGPTDGLVAAIRACARKA